MRFYLSASYKDDFSYQSICIGKRYRVPFPFRNYSINRLSVYFTTKYLSTNMSYNYRIARFMSYLYFHIKGNVLWKGLDYNHNFIKYSLGDFYIVLRKEWLSKEIKSNITNDKSNNITNDKSRVVESKSIIQKVTLK